MATRKTRRSMTRATGKAAAPRKAAAKNASRKTPGQRATGTRAAASGRSAKAGRPPAEQVARPQARRRQRSATTAVKKNGMRMQTDQGTKVLWGANQRRPTRI